MGPEACGMADHASCRMTGIMRAASRRTSRCRAGLALRDVRQGCALGQCARPERIRSLTVRHAQPASQPRDPHRARALVDAAVAATTTSGGYAAAGGGGGGGTPGSHPGRLHRGLGTAVTPDAVITATAASPSSGQAFRQAIATAALAAHAACVGAGLTIPTMAAPAVAAAAAPAAVGRVNPEPQLHRDAEGRLMPCAARTSCVSTSNFLSPSTYLAPWSYDPQPPEAARRVLIEELQARGGTIVKDDGPYLAALLPFKPVGAGRSTDNDLVEFIFLDRSSVVFRSESVSTNIPSPPFCFTPGCISGPGNRVRMAELRDSLGWSTLETDEDKKWVQILLHD